MIHLNVNLKIVKMNYIRILQNQLIFSVLQINFH